MDQINAAVALVDNGEPAAALKLAQAMAVLEPTHVTAWVALSSCRLTLGQPSRAALAIDAALAASPDNAQALTQKGLVLLEQDRQTEARSALTRSLENDPDISGPADHPAARGAFYPPDPRTDG